MVKNISIIGGDLRIVKLAEMLAKDYSRIKTYALEEAESLKKFSQITNCASIENTIEGADVVICPIPLSSNNIEINTPFSKKIITLEELYKKLANKKVIAGNVKKQIKENFEKNAIQIVDVLEREELVILNTISTAEGAIQIAMEETIKTLHGSNILILGFGRVGKTLAYMLKGFEANIFCEARKQEDIAWIKTYGYKPILLNDLKENLNKFDIIMNTVPSLIIGKEELEHIRQDCLIIDLASYPGGIDQAVAKEKGIKTIWALALPGKVAPLTSAEFIKDTIYNIFKEM